MLSSISARFSVKALALLLGAVLGAVLGIVPGAAGAGMPNSMAVERFEVGPGVYVRALALDPARGRGWGGRSAGQGRSRARPGAAAAGGAAGCSGPAGRTRGGGPAGAASCPGRPARG